MRVLCFGDSIMYGQSDPAGGWVQRLRAAYETVADNKHELYNLGICGDIASGVVKRLALETESRRWFDEEVVIIVGIGLNDSKFHNNTPLSEPELYKGELLQLVAAAHQYTTKLLFVGLTPVDDVVRNPAEREFGFTNERVQQFDAVLREFCQEQSIPIVELFDELTAHHGIAADGAHLNETGAQFVADQVKPELDRLLP